MPRSGYDPCQHDVSEEGQIPGARLARGIIKLAESTAMRFETLYRTDARGKTFDGFANPETEYYQPRIEVEYRDGKQAFFVRETHGYFDDQQKRPANITVTLSPDEGFSTLAEAERRYEEQLRYRASNGFVHAFAFDPFSPDRSSYRVLNPKATSLLA